MGRSGHRRFMEVGSMSTYEFSDRNVVAEDLAEYGLVVLVDEESEARGLSALRRGIAADAGDQRPDQLEETGGSFVFVVPWYTRKESRRLATATDG
jgi:hypothetical protein